MEPTQVEKESRRVARLLLWAREKHPLSFITPDWLEDAAESVYGNRKQLDALTQLLCQACQEMPDDLIYNGRDKMARQLADWWDAHQEADAMKEALAQQEEEERVSILHEDASYEDIREELKHFPTTWYPDLLRAMIEGAHTKGVFRSGQISTFVASVENELDAQSKSDLKESHG